MSNIGVFLDRDGTINEEVGFLTDLNKLHLIDNAGKAIRILNDRGLKTIVISNQSGVARGHFTEELVTQANGILQEKLKQEGATIDAFYYCPHHPEGTVEKYNNHCECRKPEPGMLYTAAKEFDLDLSKSFMIGDRLSDVGVAHRVNAKSILVLTGYGKENLERIKTESLDPPEHVADHLFAAVQWVLGQINPK